MTNLIEFYTNKTAAQSGLNKNNNQNLLFPPPPKHNSPAVNKSNDVIELNEKFEQAKKQNGLIEKLADKIKNITKVGYGSKKIEQSINEVENGSKNKEDVLNEIKNYRRSQENTAQGIGDILSVFAAAGVFFLLKNKLVKCQSIAQVNMDKIQKITIDFVKNLNFERLPKILSKYKDTEQVKKLANNVINSKKIMALPAIPAMFVGMFVKNNGLKLNRIGTKQYKAEIDKDKMSKDEIKKSKRTVKKEKKNANFRNGLTGAINGLTLPIIGFLGPVGVPIYIAVNSLSRYFLGTKEDKGEKSLKSYVDNIKSSKIIHAAAAVAMAIPLVKSGKYSKVLEQNAKKTVEELKKAKLTPISEGKTVYGELQEYLFSDKKIAQIMESDLPVEDKIKQLSDTNIFALKFKQISDDGDELTRFLREKCPQTWSLEDAQKQINATYGEGKYQLKKCVGTGTVAQTFVAQDKNGKNVCVKLIHKGIDEQKILKDKQAFIQMINSSSKTEQEKKFLIDNIENLASGIQAEVNLQNEMDAALKLAKTTKMANVVKPIEVKNNIYVMERADGISLADFNEFGEKIQNAKWNVEFYKSERAQQNLDEIVAKFKEKIGIDIDFDDLTKEETVKMIDRYQDVLNEQFSKVDTKGKVIHGDIHPGNIFIDVKKLKAGDKNFFTLIDTGNTIEQTKEQALRFMNLTQYIKNADVDNIADFVLDGAVLPKNMSPEKAREELVKELKKVFFDKETAIGIMTNDSLLSLTDNMMKKLNIIPSATQGNLLKAKKSSQNSLTELYNVYMNKFSEKFDDLDGTEGGVEVVAKGAKLVAEVAKDIASLKSKDKIKRNSLERANLAQLTPAQKLKIRKSPNTPKANSEEQLTYFFKQYKFDDLFNFKFK